jgi:hypothetical protein
MQCCGLRHSQSAESARASLQPTPAANAQCTNFSYSSSLSPDTSNSTRVLMHNPGVHHTGLDQEHITSHTSSAPHSSLHNSSHHRGPPLPQHKPQRSHHHERCMTVWAQQQPHLLKTSGAHQQCITRVHQVCLRCAWRRSNPQATNGLYSRMGTVCWSPPLPRQLRKLLEEATK